MAKDQLSPRARELNNPHLVKSKLNSSLDHNVALKTTVISFSDINDSQLYFVLPHIRMLKCIIINNIFAHCSRRMWPIRSTKWSVDESSQTW